MSESITTGPRDRGRVANVAEAGELVHDRGSGPREGWFIVSENGYFDVDNAVWCKPQDGDAPWTAEWFELFGTVRSLVADCVMPRACQRN